MDVTINVFKNPMKAYVAQVRKSDSVKFFEGLYDLVHELFMGKKYYAEIDRMEQDLIAFTIAASEEVQSAGGTCLDEYDIDDVEVFTGNKLWSGVPKDSGAYCIIDNEGNRTAYGMREIFGHYAVFKYDVEFDDLYGLTSDQLLDVPKTLISTWRSVVFLKMVNRLNLYVPELQKPERLSTLTEQREAQRGRSKEELTRFLFEEVGYQAFISAKQGAIQDNAQSIYFSSPGKFREYKFVEDGDSLRIYCVQGVHYGEEIHPLNFGTLHSIGLDDLDDVLMQRN